MSLFGRTSTVNVFDDAALEKQVNIVNLNNVRAQRKQQHDTKLFSQGYDTYPSELVVYSYNVMLAMKHRCRRRPTAVYVVPGCCTWTV